MGFISPKLRNPLQWLPNRVYTWQKHLRSVCILLSWDMHCSLVYSLYRRPAYLWTLVMQTAGSPLQHDLVLLV
ncbi:hypothetical protein F8388_002588 [Cannabis sativa]|uniref:Uncharacterized protein n=1 Tax=Cannabis sativa TaxID=3483 RepID=A0A7J6FB97_CANSA|nr:hypothetical protein F8388_002588 [Cannabis sativa]